MSSFGYFLRESLQGFTRNLSTTLGSIITIFLSLLIIGVFLVAAVMVEGLVSSVEDEVTITAYVADDADQSDIDRVMDAVRNMSDVQNVTFTTKEQALENFSNSISNAEIIEQLDGQNPLPASIDVELSDPQMVESVASQLEGNSTYQRICENPEDVGDSIKYGQDTVERLFAVTNYVRYIGLALIVLLVFIALVFINNTIRLAILARRKEIAIMRLVGASNGALHALIGSLFAVLIIQLLRMFAIPQLQNSLQFLSFDVPGLTYLLIYAALVVAGLLIGLLGSALAMRRYLKV